MSKKILASCILCTFSHAAFTQTPPSAGSQLQQFSTPASTPGQSLSVDIQEQSTPIPDSSESTETFLATQLIIAGSTAFTEAELLAVSGFVPNQLQSLRNLYAKADNITAHYKSKNYLLARAYLPAQEINDGVVTITVLEGNYGKISVNNSSGVSDALALGAIEGLVSGDPVELEPLENRLLSLSDVPGVEIRSTLIPGSSVGLTDLIVDVTPGPPISGSIDFDNAGMTPAGRFVAQLGKNISNQLILWVDYDDAISLHPVRSVSPRERRLRRLSTPDSNDNRISYGCINVPRHFFDKVVIPSLSNFKTVMYVMPEVRAMGTVFKGFNDLPEVSQIFQFSTLMYN